MDTSCILKFCSANATKSDCFSNNLISQKIHKEIREGLKSFTHPTDAFENIKRILKEQLKSSSGWYHSTLPVLIEQHPCLSRFRVEFIGSTSEGLSLDEFSETGYNIEVDVTTIIETIQASENPKLYRNESFVEIQRSEEFRGFATLRLHHPETIGLWNGFCNIMSNVDGTINEFYISPESVTDELYLMTSYRNATENLASFINLECFERDEDLSSVDRPTGSDNIDEGNESDGKAGLFFISKEEGPAIKTTTLSKDWRSFQFDCCTAIKCTEWPSISDPFKRRIENSKWLSSSQTAQITAVDCILVPKSPSATTTNLEWRYSFCLVEREIMQCLTVYQKNCYVLVKAIWRKFLNPPHGKGLTSYHLKNVVMWECEDLTVEDWTEDLTVRRVHGIFQRLCKYLVDGYCPHFILPDCNLFIDIEPGVLFRGAQRVQTVIFQYETVWTDNNELFFLQAQQTRKIVGEKLLEISYDVMISLLEKMISKISHESERETDLEDHVVFSEQRSKLQAIFSDKWANFALDYIKEAGRKPENIYNFMCARAPPKQLLKFAHEEGALYGTAMLISEIMALGEMLDFLVKMNVLNTGNFGQYGFHPAFSGIERLQLILKYGSLDTDEHAFEGMLTGSLDTDEHALEEMLTVGGCDDRNSNSQTDEEFEAIDEYLCDICDGAIQGSRFHCTVCKDFDMCYKCHSSNNSHEHDFVEIEEEEDPAECPTS